MQIGCQRHSLDAWRGFSEAEIRAMDGMRALNFWRKWKETPSSYAMARHIGGKLPFCVWQAGKVFRRETNDGASAAKLRFSDFWQLEFQCIYRTDTKVDYLDELIKRLSRHVERFTDRGVRVIPSDSLPRYSESTLDIEVYYNFKWREIASCSIRTDFSADTRVCEIAFGLDRIATIACEDNP